MGAAAFGNSLGRSTSEQAATRVVAAERQTLGGSTREHAVHPAVAAQRQNLLRGLAPDLAREVDAEDGEAMPRSRDACAGISAHELETFLRIVEASQSIERHQELQQWLQGEMQRFIQHEVLISAHGHFDTWQLKLDVISALPGVRTQLLAQCDINGLLKALFERWVANERKPFVLHSLQGLASDAVKCGCPLHLALRDAKSVLVHGFRDERGDRDSLYVALHTTSGAKGCLSGCFNSAPCFLVDSLVTRIDIALRKVASFPAVNSAPAALRNGGPSGLSERERELMEWICKGKTNFEAGMILGISSFTVKNHIQRIFQKIGANNRVHATTLYRERFTKQAVAWRS